MNVIQQVRQSLSKALWNEYGTSGGTVGYSGYDKDERKTNSQLLREFKNIVYPSILAIAEDVAKYEPLFLKPSQVAGKETVVQDHPLLRALKNPNPFLSQFDMFMAIQAYKEITGECFLYIQVNEGSRKPIGAKIMRPDKVKVAIDEITGDVEGYTYRRDDGTEIPLELDEVMHFKTFNPDNPYRGLSPIQAGILYIDTETYTARFQKNFIKNQATPSGILTLKGNVSKEAFDKIKIKWLEQQSGVVNAGKTLFIREADADFKKIGLSIADLDLKSLKDITEDKVLKIFRVPEAILGKTDSSGLGRANVEAVEYIFAKRTIEPKLISIDDTIRLYLNRTDKTNRLNISHVSQIPEDKEAELREDQAGVDIWVTRNEIREKRGKPPVKGGDKLYYTFNQVDITSDTDTTEKKIKRIMLKKEIKPLTKSQEDYYRSLDIIEDKSNDKYVSGLKKLLREQESEVKEQVRNSTKTMKQSVEMVGFEFIMSFTKEELSASVVATLLDVFVKGGDRALAYLGKPDEEFVLQQATRDAIFNSTERQLQSFNKETAQKLQRQLAEGLAAGEDTAQLTKRVELIYEEAKGYRAKRIAKTESHNTINEGVASAYRQAGYRKLVWRNQGDSCEFCRAMEGREVSIGQPFISKGDKVISDSGKEYLADYTDVKYANLHPECDCKLEPSN